MDNIALTVAVEGQSSVMDSDWYSVRRTLAFRGLEQGMLNDVYTQLIAGVKVSTRGLTLGMRSNAQSSHTAFNMSVLPEPV
ncbi:hypothetical protein L2725_07395 [Shewanella corallii]|uniref:Uncharacterized protein n=2 Tax=Shewanella TaxID=22 RepID=A0ABT0N5B4_9GAMM|nr:MULTISPECIES: hypothetical protein [Shewanella]MCL1037124.1 hypothetical protein [Shewanella submarina]MCL2913613.1 hypothetical protein [Shewanella corallii]